MKIPTLKSENLILRAFEEQDVQSMHQVLIGQDVLQYFPNTTPPSAEQVERMIQNMLIHWDDYGYGLWAVATPDGNLMGRCGLQYLSDTDEIEVDFILGPRYWGQGFATEAGQTSLKYGFETLGFDTIVGITHIENKASQRVLEKIGMRFTEAKEYFGMACYRYAIERR